jgi:hypothetical protein
MSDAEIKIYQGDSIKLEFKVRDDEGHDFDVTDFTVRKFIVKETKDTLDVDAYLVKDESQILNVIPGRGEMELDLLTATVDVPPGRWWYELSITDPVATKTYVVLQGIFTVIQRVAEVV